jgi:hypothetical protein
VFSNQLFLWVGEFIMKRICVLTAIIAAVTLGTIGHARSANGTWEAYPGQGATYQTSVQQPINADGSSNFKANGKVVIPVKFGLASGSGSFVFESIGSNQSTTDDYSYVSFTPSSPLTLSEITELSAVYTFTKGDCHGGSLRWQVRTDSGHALFIYYGTAPQFGNGGAGGCTAASGDGQTGSNLITLPDLRYDTSQYAGGTFYDTYAHALTLMGGFPIVRASLILDSGWGGDQQLTLTSATLKTAGYTETFTPSPSGSLTATCPTQPASIVVTKTDAIPTGAVNEPETIQPQDNDGLFRIVDCKYMYNLATSSLSGVGTYSVYAKINGVTASGPAVFDLK